MKEKGIEKKCADYVKFKKKGVCIKLYGMRRIGVPDRLFLWPHGKIVFVEFKKPGKDPSPMQDFWLAKLGSMGFVARRCDNVEDFKTIIDLADT